MSLVALVLTGIVPFQKLGVPDPIGVGVDAAGAALRWLRPVVKIGGDRRIEFGCSGDVNGTAQNFLLNGKRWLVATSICSTSSQV